MEETMNYYKNKNNEVFAYDDEQVEQGYGKDLTAITEAEKDVINSAKQEVERLKPENQLAEAKQYLSDTDWIVVKINEVAITGGDTAPLLTKYADILSERENKRLTINQLQI